MSILERTRFGDWTEYGYSSFYKRYVGSLAAVARGRFGCPQEAADALAHSFIADQACSETGGLLATFDGERHFRPYLVASFFNHCRRNLAKATTPPIEFDPAAPPRDQPEWSALAEEAENLRCRVRKTINLVRQELLERRELPQEEYRYLELKWPVDSVKRTLSDLEIGRTLVKDGLLEDRADGALTRAACRIGEKVGRKLLYSLRAGLREEYTRYMPEARVASETAISLKAIVHILSLEEQEEAT